MERLATLLDNAVLVRELRRRMRGRTMMFALMIYVALMSLVAYLILYFTTKGVSPAQPQQMLRRLSEIGQALFYTVAVIQGFLVLIIAPMITSAMTTMEKEKKTFEFLQVTPIKTGSYVLGGLASTLLYVLLALLCGLPVISISFLYGGIGVEYVLASFGILLGGALILSSVGLAISSAKEKTRTAQGMTVSIVIFVFMFGFGGLQWFFYYISRMRGAPLAFLTRQIQFFGMWVPTWIYWACAVGLLSAFALIIAARKLYKTDARAFSYQQFFILFLIAMFLVLGVVWRDLNEGTFMAFLVISVALLFGAVLTFSVGRMEIGDDIWRLKRRYLWLRRMDESVWYLLGLLAIWMVISSIWAGAAHTRSLRFAPISCVTLFCAPLFFLIVCGRLISGMVSVRRLGVRLLFGIAALLFLVVPLVAVMVQEATRSESVMLEVLRQLSPFFVLPELMGDRLIWGWDRSLIFFGPGVFTTAIYLIAGLCVAVLMGIVTKRKKAARDFHYEFPV